MKQHEAVIATLERLGGVATLGELYREVPGIPDCRWRTRTSFASIRRIVQQHPAIFKLKPGPWPATSACGFWTMARWRRCIPALSRPERRR